MQHLKKVSINDLPSQGLSSYLTVAELEAFANISSYKQDCWLVGRFAAKSSIKDYYSDKGVKISDQQIEICNRASGVPYYKLHNSEKSENSLDFNIHLSISHCQDLAVANCVPSVKIFGLGVDVEKIRDFEIDTIKAFLKDDEFAKYQSTAEEKKPQFATLYWSIKESFLKAMGTGIRIHPEKVSVTIIGEGLATVALIDHSQTRISNSCFEIHEGEFVVASSILTS